MRNANQHQRALVGWMSLAQLISWGSVFYTFSLVMEPVERELGLSRGQSSLAFSLALLVEGLLAYPVGRWIDRGHERVVVTGGSVLAGVCLVPLALAWAAAPVALGLLWKPQSGYTHGLLMFAGSSVGWP